MTARSLLLGLVGIFVPAAALAADPATTVQESPRSHSDPSSPAVVIPTETGSMTGASDCCAPSCYDCLCGPPGRVWVSAEWLYWTAAGQPLPALITTSPPGTPRDTAGTLGTPGTVVLFGNGRVNDDFRNGLRVRAGAWLDDCQKFGVEADFFFLGRSRDAVAVGSDGSQILTRPFVNALTGMQDAELVSFPGVIAGTVVADTSSDVIGGGFSFVHNLCCDPCGRFDLISGFRYLNLRDELTISENLTALPGSGVTPGTNILVRDRFATDNDFYGWSIGGSYERRFGSLFVGVRGSVALGVSHQEIEISGSSTFIPPGQPATTMPGGLLAQGSNSGSFTNDEFAVLPEVGVRFGTQLGKRARVFVGYDWLYWSTVSRAGDQIDLNLNPNQLPPAVPPVAGPAVPSNRANVTDFWLQGVSVGAEFRF